MLTVAAEELSVATAGDSALRQQLTHTQEQSLDHQLQIQR